MCTALYCPILQQPQINPPLAPFMRNLDGEGSCYPALPQGGNESPPGLTLSPHSLAFLKDAEECSLSTEAGKGGGTGSDIIKWPG